MTGTQFGKQSYGLQFQPSVQCCSLARISLSDHRAQGDSCGPCIPYPGEEPPLKGSPTFTGIYLAFPVVCFRNSV